MSFSTDLLSWYDGRIRDLPWRGEQDPYRIWLSEIMLQQTQAATVRHYYIRFLEHFPTVFHLAKTDEQSVLKLWEGLGYYSRARNLQKTARIVAENLSGRFPDSAKALLALPGIGPYTANAIASIAYGEPVPALDGNQARVIARAEAWDHPLKTPFDLLTPALERMDPQRPGDYNQALMDLGATLCTPRAPACEGCPVAAHCRAHLEGDPLDYPRKSPPSEKKQQERTVLLLAMDGRILVRRREGGLLEGLYGFVDIEGHHDPERLLQSLPAMGFVGPVTTKELPDSRHVFTHRIWRMKGWMGTCLGAPQGYIPVDAAALSLLPFPSAFSVYLDIAREWLGPPHPDAQSRK